MKETIVLSNINDVELQRSLSLKGQSFFNVRFFNALALAKEALLRKGIVINKKEISSTKQECVIYSFLKDIDYFKDGNFVDAKNINDAITYARKLCRGNEETKIEEVFSDGEFKEKNDAILKVYRKYKQYLIANNLTDSIEIINQAIAAADKINAEFIIFEETTLEPLEEELLKVVSGDIYTKKTIKEFAGRKDKKLTNVTYANAYGAVNEVEYILGYIAKNNIAYEDCTIALVDNSYINQFISYKDTYNIPMTFATGIMLSSTNAYKVLTLLDRWNKGYNGYDSLNSLINASEFDTDKLWAKIDETNKLTSRDKQDILKVIGNMRINVEVDDKYDNYKNSIKDKKEIARLPIVEFIVNELHQGYSYLIKNYTKNSVGELEAKAINTICSYLDEYFENVVDGTLVDVINSLSNKMIARQLSMPASIHISDLSGGLTTFRKHLFICGLNAKSFPGSPTENYLLLDSDLERFAEPDVKNSTNKVKFNKKLLFDVLADAASFDTNIHLSYSGYNLSELKVENPSSLLFEIYKLEHDVFSTMEEFEKAVGEQHKYFDEDITSLRVVGRKYLEGFTSEPAIDTIDICSKTTLKKIITPSNADIFFTCPRRFYLTQVLGIDEPQNDDPFNALPANDEGSLIHECMEDYGNNPNWTFEEYMANAENKLNDYFNKRIPIHTNNIDTIKKNYLAMAKEGYDSNPKNHIVECSEKWLGTYVDPITGLSFGGIVDRIEKLPNGKYVIVDYKTYKDIKNEKDDIKSCFQVVLYAYLLENMENKEVERCEYRYLRNPRTIECTYDDVIKQNLHKKLQQIKDALDTGDFPCAPKDEQNETCKYCLLGNICGKNKIEEEKEAQDEQRSQND